MCLSCLGVGKSHKSCDPVIFFWFQNTIAMDSAIHEWTEFLAIRITPQCRLVHLYQGWRYGWNSFFLLVLYYSWCNYICILVATTCSFLFLSVLHYSCCNCTHTCFPVLSEERLLWYPPIETLKCFNKKNSWPYLYISVQTIVLNVTITKIIS